MSNQHDASLEDLLDSLLNSYKEALDKINHQEMCFKRGIAEIPLLKLDVSQSVKREEDLKKQFLQAKQEFTDYRKKCIERVQRVSKFAYEILPKWLKDQLQAEDLTKEKTNETEKVAESGQVNDRHLNEETTSEVCIL